MLGKPNARVVLGLIMAVIGGIWTLQGLDVFGQDGGMNGQGEWIVIGAVTVAAGLAVAATGFLARSRS